jgi:hypothetical protein
VIPPASRSLDERNTMILKILTTSYTNGHAMISLQNNGEFAGYMILINPIVIDELKKVDPKKLTFETDKTQG